MLSLLPHDIMEEIREAEAKRDKHLIGIIEVIRRIAGSWWRRDLNIEPTPENYAWAYLQYMAGQLVFEVPGCDVKAKAEVSGAEIAQGLKIGLNHWCEEISVKEVLDEAAFECLAGFCMTQNGVEAKGDYDPNATGGAAGVHGDFESMPAYPFCDRISRHHIIIDAHCKSVRQARILGRQFDRDLDDVKADEAYDPQARDQVTSWCDRGDEKNDPYENSKPQLDRRKTVKLYNIYLPEHKLMMTLAPGAGADAAILQQTPYEGPDEGPFKLWGLCFIPDEPYPVPPLVAIYERFLELQQHATKASTDASTSKEVAIVESQDMALATKLGNANNGAILTATSLNGVLPVKLGGANPFTMEYIMYLKQSLDQEMGFTSTQRGQAGGKTATGEKIAQGNADWRVDKMRQNFTSCFKDVLRKVTWFLWYVPTISFIATHTDPLTGEKIEGTFSGGVFPGQEMFDPADFDIEIDPQSMVKEDDALVQKRALDLLQIVGSIAPQVPTMPWIKWNWLLDTVGDALGYTRLSEKVLNMDVIAMMGLPMFLGNSSMGGANGPGMPGWQGGGGPPGGGPPMPGPGMPTPRPGGVSAPNMMAGLGGATPSMG